MPGTRSRVLRFGGRDYVLVFLASLVFMPFIFTPAHWLGTGYLTSVGNLVAVGWFQAVANSLTLALAWVRLRRRVVGVG